VIQIATIQKPVPAPSEAPAAMPSPRIAIAPAPEIPPIEKPATQERESSVRPVQLVEEPHGWILPNSTWKALDKSLVKLDFDTAGSERYIGVRFVIPFGGR
jgi:hypothetical protein